MLDTNMVSYIVKGTSTKARDQLNNLRPDDIVCISAITEAELRYGLAKMQQSPRRIEAAEQFLAFAQVLPWTTIEAQAYGPIRAQQQASGKTISGLDLLIAVHAITTHSTLVTRDKAFFQISGLIRIENWATDL